MKDFSLRYVLRMCLRGGRTLAGCARFGYFKCVSLPGGHRRGETPVPIPNTAVKLSSADGTAWVTVWESRSLPGLFVSPELFKFRAIFLARSWGDNLNAQSGR